MVPNSRLVAIVLTSIVLGVAARGLGGFVLGTMIAVVLIAMAGTVANLTDSFVF